MLKDLMNLKKVNLDSMEKTNIQGFTNYFSSYFDRMQKRCSHLQWELSHGKCADTLANLCRYISIEKTRYTSSRIFSYLRLLFRSSKEKFKTRTNEAII